VCAARRRGRPVTEKDRDERNQRFAFDRERAATAGVSIVGGADEAGRGALAGPLVAAAVAFDYRRWSEPDEEALVALDDSKRLDRARREELYGEILHRALRVVCVARAPSTIDDCGLHVCNLEALAEALQRLEARPSVLLVDGLTPAATAPSCEVVVGGDGRSAAIAAASVVAKVTRDRVMRHLHERYPQWGFAEHVGYATESHHAAIAAHGLCVLHRRSFRSVAYRQLELGA